MEAILLKKKLYSYVTALLLAVTALLFYPSQSHALSGNEASYFYWLQSGKPSYQSTSYGSWTSHKGSIVGPGTMKKGYSTKSTFSITGSAGIPVKAVEVGLEAGFTKENTLSTSVSRSIPKGKTGVFQTRYQYKTYKVKMVQWISIDGRKSKTGKTKYVTVKKRTDVQGRIILK